MSAAHAPGRSRAVESGRARARRTRREREPAAAGADAAEGRVALLARLRGHLESLASQVDAVKRDPEFTAFLEAMALFWHYSPFNAWLIRWQLPGATRVAGVRTWAKLGRTIRGGARPIAIWAPTGHGFPFIGVSVYDVSQTEGRPVPVLDTTLHGSTSQARVLERAATRLGIEVVPLTSHAGLVGASVGGRIGIREGISTQERAATLAHELAHEILHQGAPARKRGLLSVAQKETEAEATAYVVACVLGLPSKAPAYVAWRGGDGKRVLGALGRVQRAARVILEAARR